MTMNHDPSLERLAGAIDLHIHAAPDILPRKLDDLALARQALEAGMRTIALKSHFEPTAGRARLATDATGMAVIGGVALNWPVGGLNHHAVEYALAMGARIVWLPTAHAAQFLSERRHAPLLSGAAGRLSRGITLLNRNNRLVQAMPRILSLVAEHDAILATGHVSVAEARAVIRQAAAQGVGRILVTHPLASFVGYSVAEMKEMLDLGASYLEITYAETTPVMARPVPVTVLADAVRAVGPSHCIMSTDCGQSVNPPPVVAMARFMRDMTECGFSEQAIRAMTVDNPARLLGL